MTRAAAKPSWPLDPTVWMAVAQTRGSRAAILMNLRIPLISGSWLRVSSTRPSRMTLSMMMRLPGRDNLSANWKYSGMERLSASMNERSNGPPPSAAICGKARFRLDRDKPAIFRQGARKPNRAVAAERADFEDPARALEARKNVQELALRRSDGNPRETRGIAGFERGFKSRIGRCQHATDVLIGGGPKRLAFAHRFVLLV